jgi:uncharacterized protein YukE
MAAHINPLDIIHRIGQAPIGDPAAMNARATRLRADADHLAGLIAGAAGRVNAMPYEGPAATRFRGEIADCTREAAIVVEHLHNAATTLQRAAGNVAAAQRGWQQRFKQVEAELLAAARASGRH